MNGLIATSIESQNVISYYFFFLDHLMGLLMSKVKEGRVLQIQSLIAPVFLSFLFFIYTLGIFNITYIYPHYNKAKGYIELKLVTHPESIIC